MKIILDKSLEALGVKHVVIGIAKNVDPNAELTPAFLQKQKEVEEWALQCNIDEVIQHPFIQGYIELMQKVGRSIKKNPQPYQHLFAIFNTVALCLISIVLLIFIMLRH